MQKTWHRLAVMASFSIAATVAGVATAGESGHYAGESVEVEWMGKYWPAHVLSTVGDKLAVHFDGYADEWDDVVSAQRIAPRHAPSFFVERREGDSVAFFPVRILHRANDGHMLVRDEARVRGDLAVDGARVHRQSASGKLHVERGGAYYAATVVGSAPGGLTRVHYDGASGDRDESVSASRMRQLAPF